MTHSPPTLPRPRQPRSLKYPTSDGKPMAETELHVNVILYLLDALKARYHDDPNVYVMGNNFVFWQEGNPKLRVSPDCYVVFGVSKRTRDSYQMWAEGGKAPDVVFEITSGETWREDLGRKKEVYEGEMQVAEYFLFDPKEERLRPRLQGYRLVEGKYQAMEAAGGRLRSERLGVELEAEGERLWLVDAQSGERLPSHEMSIERWEAAERRADVEATARAEAQRRAQTEAAARRDAEAEIERLRQELEALRHGDSR